MSRADHSHGLLAEMLPKLPQPHAQPQQPEGLPAHIWLSTTAGAAALGAETTLCSGMESRERGQKAPRCVLIARHRSQRSLW